MEELEKEKCSCGCCDECSCGDNCTCTEDNKCCESCTCGEHKETCHCAENENNETDETLNEVEEEIFAENETEVEEKTEELENEDEGSCSCSENCTCGESCECDEENKCNENCHCGENEPEVEDEKCQCGCGEDVNGEDNPSDAYFKRLVSLQAEFDNYRKRTQNDMSKAYQNGFTQAITEFLPALDSFKMATEYITDPNTLMGIQYIEKGILATLEKMGVKAIDVSGKFDPNFHQAIGSEVSAEHESGDIVKECFKGFILGDKVIRYSQVIVAK